MTQGHDIVIIGGGVAGLRAAIASRDSAQGSKLSVAIVSKVHPLRSYSAIAQGAINAATSLADSWEKHALDTVKSGDYLADQDVVEVLCREGPEAIAELDSFGLPFNRSKDSKLEQRAFGGASNPRAYFVADRTGQVMLHTLYEQALRRGIVFYAEWYLLGLLADDGACNGIIAMHVPSGKIQSIPAKATVLATGGYYSVYQSATRARLNTGDGIAVAYRAGVPLRNMEFVQFQPTTIFGAFVSLSEAARGEGGYLRNRLGERFMVNYAPQKMELAARDIIARAIQTEIWEGRGFDGGYVHLDLTHLSADVLHKKLPQVCELAHDFVGIDPSREPIPVAPGIPSGVGGIDTDFNAATSMYGLFAVGACSCNGVHGANTSGGNPLAAAMVFAKRAGERASLLATERALPDVSERLQRSEEERVRGLFRSNSNEPLAEIRKQLGAIMLDCAGLFRDERRLREAADVLGSLRERYRSVGVRDHSRRFNTDLIEVLEVGNALDLAGVIVAGARARRESRGVHYRNDYPDRDDRNWLRHTIAYRGPTGPRLSYRGVTITKFPPGARSY